MNDVETIENLIKDEVVKKLKDCKTKDDVYDVIEQLKSTFIADAECAFHNLCLDYCEKNYLEWED